MRIFVSVGTDHHPFDRLIEWATDFSAAHPGDEMFVQYGSSQAPAALEGAPLLSRDDMVAELRAADVVVVSCGPGAVMDARAAGRVPVVVPRRQSLGEHVDDHQLAFATLLAEKRLAIAATETAAIGRSVGQARLDHSMLRCEPPSGTPEGLRAIPVLVDDLVARRLG